MPTGQDGLVGVGRIMGESRIEVRKTAERGGCMKQLPKTPWSPGHLLRQLVEQRPALAFLPPASATSVPEHR